MSRGGRGVRTGHASAAGPTPVGTVFAATTRRRSRARQVRRQEGHHREVPVQPALDQRPGRGHQRGVQLQGVGHGAAFGRSRSWRPRRRSKTRRRKNGRPLRRRARLRRRSRRPSRRWAGRQPARSPETDGRRPGGALRASRRRAALVVRACSHVRSADLARRRARSVVASASPVHPPSLRRAAGHCGRDGRRGLPPAAVQRRRPPVAGRSVGRPGPRRAGPSRG